MMVFAKFSLTVARVSEILHNFTIFGAPPYNPHLECSQANNSMEWIENRLPSINDNKSLINDKLSNSAFMYRLIWPFQSDTISFATNIVLSKINYTLKSIVKIPMYFLIAPKMIFKGISYHW